MKKTGFIIGTLLLMAGIFAFSDGDYPTLKIGDMAPLVEDEMESSDGEEVTLRQLKGNNGMLVIFSCNTCPFVKAWEDRYPTLASLAEENQVGFVLLNSNEAKRDGEDSKENMLAHAQEKGYSNVPYLIDKRSKFANAFGAKTTPHVFLFNDEWKLVYEGSIDDNHKSAEDVTVHYLENAINNMVSGEKIDPNNTKAIGCSIKRIGG